MRKIVFFSLALMLSLLSYGNSILALEVDKTSDLELVSIVAFTMMIIVFGQSLGIYGVNYYLKLSKHRNIDVLYIPLKYVKVFSVNLISCFLVLTLYATKFYTGSIGLCTFYLVFLYGVLTSILSYQYYGSGSELKAILCEKSHLIVILFGVLFSNIENLEMAFNILFVIFMGIMLYLVLDLTKKGKNNQNINSLEREDIRSLSWTYGNTLIGFLFLYFDQFFLGALIDSATFAKYFLLVQFLSLYKFFPMQASKLILKEFALSDGLEKKLLSSIVFYTLAIVPIILFSYMFVTTFVSGGKYQTFTDNIKVIILLSTSGYLGLVINQYLISIEKTKELFIVNLLTMTLSVLLLSVIALFFNVSLDNVLLAKAIAIIASQLMLIFVAKDKNKDTVNSVLNIYIAMIISNGVFFFLFDVDVYVYTVSASLILYSATLKLKY